MTQFTSFVAVEEMVVTDGGDPRTVQVPVEIPQGVDRRMAVGEGEGLAMKRVSPGVVNAPPPATTDYSIGGGQIGAMTTVEVVGESNTLSTESGELGRTSSAEPLDADAAAKLGAMTNSSALGVVGTFHAPVEGGSASSPRSSKEEKHALELQQKYAARTTPELLALVACLDLQPVGQTAKCVQPGASVLYVRIALTDNSPAVLARLAQLGFRLKLAPTTAKLVYGELPAAQLKALLELKEVFFLSRAEPMGKSAPR
jgi:hypothetical protein